MSESASSSDATRALLVVESECDFCDGVLYEHRSDFGQIVAMRDWHIHPEHHFSEHPNFSDTWPSHCRAGTPGAEFSPELDAHGQFVQCLSAIVSNGRESAAHSGFQGRTDDGQSLNRLLRDAGITTIDIVGLATDYCVRATAIDAVKHGYVTSVILPLTAGVAPDTTKSATEQMQAAGVTLLRETPARL